MAELYRNKAIKFIQLLLYIFNRHYFTFLHCRFLLTDNEARDLGVLVDAQLSFKSHINGIVAKARMSRTNTS